MPSDIRARLEERVKLLNNNQEQPQQQVIPTEAQTDIQSQQNIQEDNPQIMELRQRLEARLPEYKKNNESSYETYVKRPGQILLGSTVSGAKSLPRTAFDFMKFVVDKTGGNIKDLEKAQKKSLEWLKKVKLNQEILLRNG